MEGMISIIVPMYNAESTISNTIEHILQQTYKNWELILIDDGSTDQTYSICNKYLNDDNRIVLKKVENGGPSKARNLGLRYAKGEYVTFCDADDYFDINFLDNMLSVLQVDNDIDLVICSYKSYSKKEKNLYNTTELTSQEIAYQCLDNEKIAGYLWNKMFKNDIIKKHKIRFDEEIFCCEDLLFIIKYIEKSKKAYYIDKELYYHTNQPSSIINSYNPLKKVTSLDARIKINYILKKLEFSNAYNISSQISCIQAYYIMKELKQFVRKRKINDNEKKIVKSYYKKIISVCRNNCYNVFISKKCTLKTKIGILLIVII